MFILALTVYSYVDKRKLLMYGNVALLVVIIGFTGFWVYDARLPMGSIEMNITNVRFWIGEDPHWIYGKPANTSSIFFNLTLHNPTSRDIPAFHSEYNGMQMNGKPIGSADIFGFEIWLPAPLKAQSMISTEMYVIFEQTRADPDIWALLLTKNFTFTITGVLVTRYYYAPSSLDEYERRQYSFVWATKPYSVSYTYTE